MASALDLVRQYVSSAPGTGSTIGLGVAVPGWLTFNLAGAANGTVYRYSIIDGGNSEIGTATYNSAGPSLTGRTPTKSTNSNAAINASAQAQIIVCLAAEDVGPLGMSTGAGVVGLDPSIAPTWTGVHTFTAGLISKRDTAGQNSNQLLLQGATDPNKQLFLGFDTTNNVGFIQAVWQGTSVEPLLLNSGGGGVGVGVSSLVAGSIFTTAGGTWNGTLPTGAGQNNTLGSANTGFANQFFLQNGGTGSNSGTLATYFAQLSAVTNGYMYFQVAGGASPTATISTGSGMTGGLTIGTGVGNLSLSAANGQFYNVATTFGYTWAINGTNLFIAVAGGILPSVDNTLGFGGTGNRWGSGYFTTLNVGVGNTIGSGTSLLASQNVTAPPAPFVKSQWRFIAADGDNGRMTVEAFGAAASLAFVYTGGTGALPSAPTSGQNIALFNATGYDGTAYTGGRTGAKMYAGENWSSGHNGTFMELFVTANGTSTPNIPIIRIYPTGVAITTSGITPLSMLDVSGGVAIGSFAGSTAAPTNGLLVSGDSRLGNGNAYSYFLGNNTGDPLTTINGLALGWNRSAGSGEVGFYNTYTAASDSFNWFQMTGVGTKNLLANLAPTGLWTWPGYTTPGGLGVDVNGAVIAGGYVTPQMYGAAGNGTTDDTTALSNCLNSGKPVLLIGLFKITSQITVNIGVGQTIQGLDIKGGGGQASQIICSTSSAGITVNQFYDNNSGNVLSRAGQYVIDGVTFVLTATGIGTEATVTLTTGIITSGAFVGVLNLIGKPSSSTGAMPGAAVTLGRVTNVEILSDGTGWAHCCLYLQDQRYCTFNQINIPSGIGAALSSQTQGWGIVVRATYQPLGSASTIIKFNDCQVVGGLVGAAVVPSGAPNFDCTAVTFTNGSANITKAGGGLPTLVGEKVTVSGASVPLPFVSGNSYFVVSATGGTTMQLSATSGGSAITVTGTTSATNIIIAPPMDLEGFYWVNSIAIGCGSIALALWGCDGTSNVYYVTGSTFSTNNGVASTTTYGIYSYGVGLPQYNGNNFENVSNGLSGQTFNAISHTWSAALNGFGAKGTIQQNFSFPPAGVTANTVLITGGAGTIFTSTIGNI